MIVSNEGDGKKVKNRLGIGAAGTQEVACPEV
jgi:hypothetical protein